MPRPTTSRSVAAHVLRKLRLQGADSPVLDARLRFMDAEGLARYARPLLTMDRVYPHSHPLAQASGRWSTTDPALVNFPAAEGGVAWGMVLPDLGWYFLHYDMESLHARIAAAYTKDQEDLECFRHGYDLHTRAACGMWGWVFIPPNRVEGADPPWQGKSDRRRRLAKVIRYALLLGLGEQSALESKDIEKEGLTREEVLGFARLYLRSKPLMVATKRRIWEQCIREGRARSFMGRLRRLSYDPRNRTSVTDAMKEGWSHILQGGEQDIMHTIMAGVWEAFPDALLTLNSHDGHTWAFQESRHPPHETVERLRPIVERVWAIQGESVPVPAEWEILWPDESREPVNGSKG